MSIRDTSLRESGIQFKYLVIVKMSKNFVEYGRIEHKGANNDNPVEIPRKYVFSLLVGAALLSMYNGSIYQEIFIISVMQFFWYGELVKNNSEEEVNIKERVIELASKMARLPAADFTEYNPNDYSDQSRLETRQKLDDILYERDWIKTTTVLDNIDQRLSLKIVGQDYYSNPNGTFVPVHVVGSAWDGEPPVNTMIVGVD